MSHISPSASLMRQELRNKLVSMRQQIDINFQREAACKIADAIFTLHRFNSSKNIACYLAIRGEVDLNLIIKKIWELDKNCYLPVIDKPKKGILQFVRYQERGELHKKAFGILEPVFTNEDCIIAHNLDLVIAPLVGFDVLGNRLGQGGGYYDRTFACKLQPCAPQSSFDEKCCKNKPFLLGVAYEAQKLTDGVLPVAPWDVKLDAVVTEKQIYLFK